MPDTVTTAMISDGQNTQNTHQLLPVCRDYRSSYCTSLISDFIWFIPIHKMH